MGDVRTEVDRLIAWLVATIEVERGVDVSGDYATMNRIGEEARIAHAQRTRSFSFDGFEIVVSERQLDEIFAGEAKPPDIEAHREGRKGGDSRAAVVNWMLIALVFAVFAVVAGAFYLAKHEAPSHDGEHKKASTEHSE